MMEVGASDHPSQEQQEMSEGTGEEVMACSG